MTNAKLFQRVSVATLVVAFQGVAVLGQEGTGEKETKIDVVQLRYADAEDVQAVIEEIMPLLDLSVDVFATDENKLCLVGDEKDIAQIKQTIIAKLDAPPSYQAALTATFKLNRQPVNDLIATLQKVVRSPQVRMGLDRASSTLLVSGDARSVQSISTFLSEINASRHPMTLDFFFLRGSLSPATSHVEPRLPAALAAVVKPLAENGFTGLEMLTPIRVVTYEGESFKINSSKTIKQADVDDADQDLLMTINIRGDAALQGQTETISTPIRVNVEATLGFGLRSRRSPFTVQTSLTVKPGDYTVLSAAPSSMAENEAIVLVVRATRG